MPIDIPVCPLLSLLPPTSHRGPSSEIWVLLERNRPLQLQLTLLGSTTFTLHLLSQEWSPLMLPQTHSLQWHSGAGTHLEGSSTSSASKFISRASLVAQ